LFGVHGQQLMQTSIIQQRLTAYLQWKTRLSQAVLELESWLESEGRSTSEISKRLRNTLDTLDRDRLTIAFVAEAARGKTELINALFFAEDGWRLPPSSLGGTTLCSTELLWDRERNEPYLQLLPIETRAQGVPVSQLKSDPEQWMCYPLPVHGPEQTTSVLQQILHTKRVSMAEATRLGLSSFRLPLSGRPSDGSVVIPKWRHAVVSFPHPLLKQGLVILDTPSLEVLTSEPQLVSQMLLAAQVLLFIVGADTDVTRSDAQMWQRHLASFGIEHRPSVVALNKTDALWDEQQKTSERENGVSEQRASTARTLGISEAAVFPISANKAMLAKTLGDEILLDRSGLPALESYLSSKMLQTKHRTLVGALEADVDRLLNRNRTRITNRIGQVKTQLLELEQMRRKSDDVIDHLLKRTREEQELYLEGVHRFQASREELLEETRLGRKILERDNLTSLVDTTYREMIRSWTTRGIANAMKDLFNELRQAMQTLSSDCERIRNMVNLTYRQFEKDFEFDLAVPQVFIATEFSAKIESLCERQRFSVRDPPSRLPSRGW